MERVNLPLSEMTVAEKLDLIEAIWDDVTKDEQSLEPPSWHADVLRDRQKALEAGKAKVCDWDEAKQRIRKNVS